VDIKKEGPVGNQLIPLLFTLGVIGWGFYAIEKLSPLEEKAFESSNIGTGAWVKQSKEKTGIRKWLLSEIESMSSKKKGNSSTTDASDRSLAIIADERSFAAPEEIVKDNSERDSWTPVDDDLSNDSVIKSKNSEKNQQSFLAPGERTFSVYFYTLDDTGEPVLKEFNKSTSSLGIAKAILLQLIHGAESAGGLDTFPVKPRVNSVKVENRIIVLDFGANFGLGVSPELFAYQLIQIHKSLTRLRSIDSIQIRINGHKPESIGSHGLRLPENITASHLEQILKKLNS
jgi:spore germination protein GerM